MNEAQQGTSVDTIVEELARGSVRPASQLALQRSAALLRYRMFGTPNGLLRIGRYELVRILGQGGMGVVYEALVSGGKARFALKILHEREAGLAMLKREFRGFSELRHPNLVALHELATDGEQAFLTMELIEGEDFISHVRQGASDGSAPPDEHRLRNALAQLYEGVAFLHQAGKVHRDIKPSNILVTGAGRVVLLDFGVAQDTTAAVSSRLGAIAGTPAYMAPEQAAGDASPASDWFGVGVVFYEALTGRLPCSGRPRAASQDQREPSPPSLVASGVPNDLDQLCQSLLQPSPADRPHAHAIRACLQPHTQGKASVHSRRSPAVRPGRFVGRAEPLRRLHAAFELSRSGAVLLLLRGESGIGKTRLVECALDRLQAPRRATVLRGRCYERESVPYQGLDGVAEELARHLSSWSEDERAKILPRDSAALVRMFPVLARSCGPSSPACSQLPAAEFCSHAEPRASSTFELRARAFFAFAELLANLARRTQLVLWIDDAQWGDADSGQLLATVLRVQVPMLLIVSQRSGLRVESGMLQKLRAEPAPLGARRVELVLGPLSHAEAQRLARSLLPSGRRSRKATLEIAREAAGHPLFIAELARSALAARRTPGRPAVGSMQELVQAQFRALSQPEQRLVRLVAVAGRPTARAVIVRAAAGNDAADATLCGLCLSRFVHTAGTAASDVVQIEHDRVRDVIVSTLQAGLRRQLHGALAHALETEPGADPETLVEHFLEAGLRSEATLHALRAADAAAARLAFVRAARLYTLALESPPEAVREVVGLKRKLADALATSGRGDAAAAQYLELAATTDDRTAHADLSCRAAEHLMFNGRADEALIVLRRAIESIGLRWPAYQGRWLRWVVVWQGLLLLLWPAWLGSRSPPRRCASQLDFLLSAARALAHSDMSRAIYFALSAMRTWSNASAPTTRAHLLSLRAAGLCAKASPRWTRLAVPCLEQAAQLASASDSPLARARVENVLAHAYVELGRFREARELAARAEQRLRSVPSSLFDFLDSLHVTGLTLLALGELREIDARWSAYVPDLLLRGSPMAGVCIRGHGVRVGCLLAAGELRAVRDVLVEQRRMLERFPRLGAAMITLACTEIERALYLGQGALAQRLLAQYWSTLNLPNVLSAAYVQGLRGRTALAAAREPGQRAQLPRLLRRARAAARALHGLHRNYAVALAELLLAGAAQLSGRPEVAAGHLELAIRIYDEGEMALMATCARRARATFEASGCGRPQINEIDAVLAARGVRDPVRWSESFAPGFAQL